MSSDRVGDEGEVVATRDVHLRHPLRSAAAAIRAQVEILVDIR